MIRRRPLFLANTLLAASLAACSADKPGAPSQTGTKPAGQAATPASGPAAAPTPPPPPPAAATPPAGGVDAEADMVFNTRCATCHGPLGMGDGAAAAALNPKPRSFKDAEWQKSVTDDHIAATIVKGGAAVGKSPLMAPNPDLEAKPEVVKALVARVRKLGS